MTRTLVLFAREPGREARAKGFSSQAAADVFSSFAAGWVEIADRVGARIVVATPAEDLVAWRRRLPAASGILWIAQRGATFGERLENALARASRPGGHAVVVGGDVAPDAAAASEAFEALEAGASAALAPSADGGVWLVSVSPSDYDVLRGVEVGRGDVFEVLARRLAKRGRSVAVVAGGLDVDGRIDLRRLLRVRPGSLARSLARRALAVSTGSSPGPLPTPRLFRAWSAAGLRAPPRAA